ncbi:MAG: FxsA family protein [Magnetococcales bacterium]|nr:FxsA family protein [Magnetococcales bacterium]
MMRYWRLLLVTLPFVEIWLLIWAGRHLGAGTVLLSLVAAGLIGAALIRGTGPRALDAIQERLLRDESPGGELLDAAMMLTAGAMLVLPGYLSDLAAILLLIPWTRSILRARILTILVRHARPIPPAGKMVIEGESTREENDPPRSAIQ